MNDYYSRRNQHIDSSDNWRNNAVFVKNAYKSYGRKNKNTILKGLNMNVERNTIYGLLGSSGCGKTTLLTCIVGRKSLDSGEIYVLGGKPGTKSSGIPGPKVGYMPQEISLYGEFTIRETIKFFGWIYGMTPGQINTKLDFLTQFLQLPNSDTFVGNLSGGQQRRVSLAVSLVHEPELLILDEPTVGVDPMLRHSIWQHLVDITKNGHTTIIVTTHYIDEMKQANCIGLMRGGYFLAEETPEYLMEHFETDNLEDAYLQLSIIQNNRNEQSVNITDGVLSSRELGEPSSNSIMRHNDQRPERMNMYMHAEDKNSQCCESVKMIKKRNLEILIWKNLLWFWRNKPTVVFMIFLPVVQIVLFSISIGADPKEMHIAVVNYELRWKTDCPVENGCNISHLSCRFLQRLKDRKLLLKYFNSEDEAITYVEKGKAYASITFPSNYTAAMKKRINDGKYVANWNIEYSLISIYQDRANHQIYIILWKDFIRLYLEYIQTYLTDCKYLKKLVAIPVHFNKPIYGISEPNYTDFAAPGIILSTIFFLAMAIAAGSLIVEKKEGLFERTTVAGVTEGEIVLSHIISDFLIILFQVISVLLVMFNILGYKNEGSFSTVFFLILLSSMTGMSFGYLISTFCNDERTMTMVCLGLFYPILTLCGLIWPREALHHLLRCASNFLPLSLTTDALRAILHRGWGMKESVVIYGFLCTFGYLLFYFSLTIISFKIRK